jgi:hypothetical protein
MNLFTKLKNALLLTITLLIIGSAGVNAQTNRGDLGVGFILGEPTGLSLKYWSGGNNALDLGVAWSFGGSQANVHIHGDYLIHKFNLIEVERGSLPFYYGLGARFNIREDQDARVGLRIPLGLSYYFPNDPIEIFFEIVPVLDLAPNTGFSGNSGLGMRYYFGRS